MKASDLARGFFAWRMRPGDVLRDLLLLASLGTVASLGAPWHWGLDYFSHFHLQYLVVLLPGMVFLAAARRPRAAAWCAACVIYNAALLLPLFRAPPVAARAGPAATLRVMEINLLRENGHSNQAVQVIRDAKADVVVALELTPEWLQRLEPLRADYPYIVAEPQEDCFGLAVFSRHRVTAERELWLEPRWVPSLRVVLDVNGRAVDVIATHPVPPKSAAQTQARDEQLRSLAREARARTGSLLLVGDLNATPWTPAFRALLRDGELENSGRGFGLTPTWPSFGPGRLFRIPIDHVLMSPDIRATGRRVGRAFGSDHLPLVVDLAF